MKLTEILTLMQDEHVIYLMIPITPETMCIKKGRWFQDHILMEEDREVETIDADLRTGRWKVRLKTEGG